MRALLKSLLILICSTQAFAKSPWAEMTLNDLEFMRKTLEENHPGSVDEVNTWFAKQLREGYAIAFSDANKAQSYEDYRAIMFRYANEFRDGHLNVNFELSPKSVEWTGFLLSKEGDSYIVAHTSDKNTNPRKGAKLLSCDSTSPEKILQTTVFPTVGGNIEIPATYWMYTPFMLQGSHSQWRKKFRSCSFEQDGKKQEFLLKYRNIKERELREQVVALLLDSDNKAEISDFGSDSIWIKLPTFSPRGTSLDAMQQIVDAMPKYRNKKFVVLDLRGNNGGSSTWGDSILKGLYGSIPPTPDTNTFVDWRVSAGNQKHLEHIVEYLRSINAPAEAIKSFQTIGEDMRDALGSAETYITETDSDASTDNDTPQNPSLLSNAKMVLLTDGFCASACLDFMDRAFRFPNVSHVGAATNADTLYMEVRQENLPSGLAELSFATKVYRNRLRGHNKSYEPKYVWTGAIRDTEAIRTWIKKDIIH